MRQITGHVALFVFLAGGHAFAQQQALPTSQPNLVQVIIEEVKPGHEADHARTEAGWPAAFEKAKLPYYSLGLVALTGRSQAWFLVPFDSHKAMGDALKRMNDDPVLAPELARLSRADAEHVTEMRSLVLSARKELSRGEFPDTAKQRFWDVTIFRVKPGHETDFVAAAKMYGTASGRVAPDNRYRVYEVTAGMPSPTYLVFSSVRSFDEFDKMQADGDALMKGMTKEEQDALQKFSSEALVNSETYRFRLDPEMSYVPAEVRAQDPDFWMKKSPAKKPVATTGQKKTRR